MKDCTPKTIDDIVFESQAQKDKIIDITSGIVSFPAYGKTGILLYGMPGTGKTSLSHMLPKAIEASRPNGMPDKVQAQEIWCEKGSNGVSALEQIKNVSSYPIFASASGLYYFILQEVDNLTPIALKQLKTIMEEPNVVFIMTTNNIDAFEPALLSRCECVSFNPSNPNVWIPRLQQILLEESIDSYSQHYLCSLVTNNKFNARGILTAVEKLIAKYNRPTQQVDQVQTAMSAPINANASIASLQAP